MFFELTDPPRCPPPQKKTFNITAVRSKVFSKNASFSCNVEYVECVLGAVFENVLLSGEMLNMLNGFRTYRPLIWPVSSKTIQHIQHIQHLPRKKHIFLEEDKNIFNTFNITAERSFFWKKMLLTAVMLNMLNVFRTYRPVVGPESSKKFNIQHIQHFPRKKHIFLEDAKNILNTFNITAERCFFFNVSHSCNVEYVECFSNLQTRCGARKFEKHSTYSTYSTFPQKEAHFLEDAKNIFNIFNITAERTFFLDWQEGGL